MPTNAGGPRRPDTPRIMLTFEQDRDRDGLFLMTVRHGHHESSQAADAYEQTEDMLWRKFREGIMNRMYAKGVYPATNIPEMYDARDGRDGDDARR